MPQAETLALPAAAPASLPGNLPAEPVSPAASPRFWVGVVSRSHVVRGVAGGFAQLCHGRVQALARMRVGDGLIYYSPKTDMHEGQPLKAFTAVGRVVGEGAYPFDMGGGFVPHRRDVAYEVVRAAVPVAAVAPALHFIQATPNWGMLARRGVFEVDQHDFELIRAALVGAEAAVP